VPLSAAQTNELLRRIFEAYRAHRVEVTVIRLPETFIASHIDQPIP
jgi:hypothetical protein